MCQDKPIAFSTRRDNSTLFPIVSFRRKIAQVNNLAHGLLKILLAIHIIAFGDDMNRKPRVFFKACGLESHRREKRKKQKYREIAR
jgi:hypothetical protein